MDERLIEELKALRLQPGETLVLQVELALTEEQRESIRQVIDHAGVKALVLDGGLKAVAVQTT